MGRFRLLIAAEPNTSEGVHVVRARNMTGGKDVGHPLDAIRLAHERSKGFITALPLPTEDDIKDKSKTSEGYSRDTNL